MPVADPATDAASRTGNGDRPSPPGPASWRVLAADVVGAAAALAIVVGLGFRDGGFFPAAYLAAGVVALLAAAALLVVRGPGWRASTHGLVAIAGLVAFAGWTGLSSRWSPLPDVALTEMLRQLVYAAFLVLGLAAIGTGRRARWLVLAVGTALAVVCLAGLTSRLVPDLHIAPILQPFGGYRLAYPFSYWNALGAATAMVIPLAVGIGADRRSSPVLRALATGLVPAFGVTLLLTVSRGGIIAAAVGLVVVILLARRILQLIAVGLACGVPAAIAIATAAARPAVVDDPSRAPGIADAGPGVAVAVILLGVVAAAASLVVLAAMGGIERRREQAEARRRRRVGTSAGGHARRHGPAVAAVAVVVALAGGAVASATLEGQAANGVGHARSFLDTQRRAFLNGEGTSGTGLARLRTAGGSRSALYRVALRGFGEHPLWGDGVGGFRVRWLAERPEGEIVQNAHSLPIETLSELGLPGFLLIGATIAALVFGVVRGRLRPTVLSRGMSAGVAGALAAFFVSCLIDWTWQTAALSVAALLLGAALLPAGRQRPAARR